MVILLFKILIFLTIRLFIIKRGLGLNKKKVLNKSQGRPFECGVNTLDFREIPLRMRFFILAVVFLIFDVELVLLMPFLIYLFGGTGLFIRIIFLRFLSILLLGVFLEWNNFLLEWA